MSATRHIFYKRVALFLVRNNDRDPPHDRSLLGPKPTWRERSAISVRQAEADIILADHQVKFAGMANWAKKIPSPLETFFGLSY
jgi:hypothetical protein